MDLKRTLAAILCCAWLSGPLCPQGSSQEPSAADLSRMLGRRVKVDIGASPSRGSPGAEITIIQFSDFQCSYCRKAASAMDELIDTYPGKIRLIHKNFPLPFHRAALSAAKAALAAGRQGQFWRMHDLLFAEQHNLGAATYRRQAAKLGLTIAVFEHDMNGAPVQRQLEHDLTQAHAAGVTGTPTFVINGVVVRGAHSAGYFRPIIERLLLEPPAGTVVRPLRTEHRNRTP